MVNFKKAVVINGPGGSGKDTFVEIVRRILGKYGLNIFNYSAVDEVKHWAMQMGWDGEKNEKGRKLLADLKQVSIAYNDGPTRYLCNRVENIEDGIVFLHVREPEEIAKLKERVPEVMLLHIDRPGLEIPINGADNRTKEIEYDYYVVNDGSLRDLILECVRFLDAVIPDEVKQELTHYVKETTLEERFSRLR